MTTPNDEQREEQRQRLAEMRTDLKARMKPHLQAERERKLRAGKAKPRTHAEMEIFASDLLPSQDNPDDNTDQQRPEQT